MAYPKIRTVKFGKCWIAYFSGEETTGTCGFGPTERAALQNLAEMSPDRVPAWLLRLLVSEKST